MTSEKLTNTERWLQSNTSVLSSNCVMNGNDEKFNSLSTFSLQSAREAEPIGKSRLIVP